MISFSKRATCEDQPYAFFSHRRPHLVPQAVEAVEDLGVAPPDPTLVWSGVLGLWQLQYFIALRIEPCSLVNECLHPESNLRAPFRYMGFSGFIIIIRTLVKRMETIRVKYGQEKLHQLKVIMQDIGWLGWHS